jgi:hypothetical protein
MVPHSGTGLSLAVVDQMVKHLLTDAQVLLKPPWLPTSV